MKNGAYIMLHVSMTFRTKMVQHMHITCISALSGARLEAILLYLLLQTP
jgi:hypothetical protein